MAGRLMAHGRRRERLPADHDWFLLPNGAIALATAIFVFSSAHPATAAEPVRTAQARSLSDVVETFSRRAPMPKRNPGQGSAGASSAPSGQHGPQQSRPTGGFAERSGGEPPLPVRQPKPWHTDLKRYPPREAAPKPKGEWPKLLPADAKQFPNREKYQRYWKAAPGGNPASPVRAPDQPDVIAGDTYTESERNLALARCRQILSRINAVVVPQAPIKKGPCGHPAPVKLVSLGASPEVAVVPPPTVNCDMVEALHKWLVKDLQPLARQHLGGSLTRIENMSSYSCRNAYGRKNTRLSEHAKANALDIRGFVISGKSKPKLARLLTHWGPTQRDVRAYEVALERYQSAKKLQAAKAGEGSSGDAGGAAGVPAPDRKAIRTVGQGVRIIERGTIAEGLDPLGGQAAGAGQDEAMGYAPNRLGGPGSSAAKVARAAADSTSRQLIETASKPEAVQPAWDPKAKFLKEAHVAACRIFGTTLGPEANNAHRNHFHVDMAERKYGNFCE